MLFTYPLIYPGLWIYSGSVPFYSVIADKNKNCIIKITFLPRSFQENFESIICICKCVVFLLRFKSVFFKLIRLDCKRLKRWICFQGIKWAVIFCCLYDRKKWLLLFAQHLVGFQKKILIT